MERITKQDEVEIDLKEIMALILQNALLIIMSAVCVAIFLYTDGKSKVNTIYTSTTKMYILTRNVLDDTVNGDTQFIASVLEDYQSLAKSEEILEEVNKELQLGTDYEVLASQITINVPDDNKTVTLSVMDVNPITSMRIANTLRDVMADYMKKTMNIKIFDVVEDAGIGVPYTIDKAKRNAVLGGFVVACLIMGVIAMRYLIDDSIKTPEEIESKLGLSVLSTIPISKKKTPQKDNSIFRGKKGTRQGSKYSEHKDTETQHVQNGGEIL